MPNIRVKQRLESLDEDMYKVLQHITLHSGIDKKDARLVEDLAAKIAVTAANIVAEALLAQGHPSPKHVVTDVRKSLGFTNP